MTDLSPFSMTNEDVAITECVAKRRFNGLAFDYANVAAAATALFLFQLDDCDVFCKPHSLSATKLSLDVLHGKALERLSDMLSGGSTINL
jgi:hypothetical protein